MKKRHIRQDDKPGRKIILCCIATYTVTTQKDVGGLLAGMTKILSLV
jgi:hypothetical protein